MNESISRFDNLLENDGPAAILTKQWLKPVGGDIFFPPTYANPSQQKGDPPVYNIDRFGESCTLRKVFDKGKAQTYVEVERTEQGKLHSVCVVDSIPSQANRIEPELARIADGKLVPQVTIKVKCKEGTKTINLLEAGHRAADAVVRFSSLREDLDRAFESCNAGDALLLAKIAPTSLVFGMWDSRGTGLKVPRLVNSIIRAYDVIEYRRSAQYFPATDYVEAGVVAEGGEKLKKLADEGMAEVPATFLPGGIEARGGICREASLNLATLRDIATVVKRGGAGKGDVDRQASEKRTRELQRYVLGLSLIAITWFDSRIFNLRQGCQLVLNPEKPATRVLVNADGTETDFAIDRDTAVSFASEAAKAFGIGEDREATFDPKAAKDALK